MITGTRDPIDSASVGRAPWQFWQSGRLQNTVDEHPASCGKRTDNQRRIFVETSLRKTLFLIALTLSCAVTVSAKPAPNAGDVAVKPTPTQAQTAVLAARFLTRFH